MKTIPYYWDKTVTVFTPEYDDQSGKAVWHKSVYENAYYAHTSASSFKSDDMWRENRVACRIPQKNVNVIPGSTVVFLGEVEENIPDGRSANELKKQHPEHFTVKSVTHNDCPLPHTHLTGA